jgi:hypothetical protein
MNISIEEISQSDTYAELNSSYTKVSSDQR